MTICLPNSVPGGDAALTMMVTAGLRIVYHLGREVENCNGRDVRLPYCAGRSHRDGGVGDDGDPGCCQLQNTPMTLFGLRYVH
mmetsp:Transcript_12971/g.31612  ORF Transcript_12971/g.31612 Transcript_12971/m.31612 type:complete len:83 (-) Transcript_12971:3430-3678(-)